MPFLSKRYLCYFLKAALGICGLLKTSSVPTTVVFWGGNFSTAGSTRLLLVATNGWWLTRKSDVFKVINHSKRWTRRGNSIQRYLHRFLGMSNQGIVVSRQIRQSCCSQQWYLTALHQALNLIWMPEACRNQPRTAWQNIYWAVLVRWHKLVLLEEVNWKHSNLLQSCLHSIMKFFKPQNEII